MPSRSFLKEDRQGGTDLISPKPRPARSLIRTIAHKPLSYAYINDMPLRLCKLRLDLACAWILRSAWILLASADQQSRSPAAQCTHVRFCMLPAD